MKASRSLSIALISKTVFGKATFKPGVDWNWKKFFIQPKPVKRKFCLNDSLFKEDMAAHMEILSFLRQQYSH